MLPDACTFSNETLTTIIDGFTCLIGLTIPIAVMLALLFFFWNVFQGFGKLDNAEKRKEIRQSLLWSIIALFVVVTLGGIIAIFSSTFPDLQP